MPQRGIILVEIGQLNTSKPQRGEILRSSGAKSGGD